MGAQFSETLSCFSPSLGIVKGIYRYPTHEAANQHWSCPPAQRFENALMVLPDQAARDIDPIWFSEGEKIRVADAFSIAFDAKKATFM
jgi:hypothetical protein